MRNNFQRRLLSPSGETREISAEDMEGDKFCEALLAGEYREDAARIPMPIRAIKGLIDLSHRGRHASPRSIAVRISLDSAIPRGAAITFTARIRNRIRKSRCDGTCVVCTVRRSKPSIGRFSGTRATAKRAVKGRVSFYYFCRSNFERRAMLITVRIAHSVR